MRRARALSYAQFARALLLSLRTGSVRGRVRLDIAIAPLLRDQALLAPLLNDSVLLRDDALAVCLALLLIPTALLYGCDHAAGEAGHGQNSDDHPGGGNAAVELAVRPRPAV